MKMNEPLFLGPCHYQLFQARILCVKPLDEYGQRVSTNLPNCFYIALILPSCHPFSMQILKPEA
jgi:hypothetical protein